MSTSNAFNNVLYSTNVNFIQSKYNASLDKIFIMQNNKNTKMAVFEFTAVKTTNPI